VRVLLLCLSPSQVAAKEAEVTRLANDVDSLGLQLGRARGELAKQVCVCEPPSPLEPSIVDLTGKLLHALVPLPSLAHTLWS
jgi:hypothetical protein